MGEAQRRRVARRIVVARARWAEDLSLRPAARPQWAAGRLRSAELRGAELLEPEAERILVATEKRAST